MMNQHDFLNAHDTQMIVLFLSDFFQHIIINKNLLQPTCHYFIWLKVDYFIYNSLKHMPELKSLMAYKYETS